MKGERTPVYGLAMSSQKNVDRVVLVTGCSTGIGRSCVEAFLLAGCKTIATARNVSTLQDLERRGAQVAQLDVTIDEHRRKVVGDILQRHGRLDVLVNNAGYPEYGPFEEIDLDRWRAQFETNVFGLVAMSQLVVPAMRAHKSGRIINISSIGGIVTLPLGSAYHASKWAVEALSDVARFELKPFGIDVVVIEPGVVLTNFEQPAQKGLALDSDSPYASLAAKFSVLLNRSYAKKTFNSISPDTLAAVVVKAATARRPRARYIAPVSAKTLAFMRPLIPDRLFDAILRTQIR